MEGKTLLPYAKMKRGGEPLSGAATLRKGPRPDCSAARALPDARHLRRAASSAGPAQPARGGHRGSYAACDVLAGDEAQQVVERLTAQPSVPMAQHYDGPLLSKRHG